MILSRRTNGIHVHTPGTHKLGFLGDDAVVELAMVD